MIDAPEHLHRAFQDAFNRHDLEAIVALYEPGAVLGGRGEPAHGIDAIRERYRAVLAARPSIFVSTLGAIRAGDLAMLHGKWVLHETNPDGTVLNRNGRNTETARRQRDGRWLFVIDNPSVPQD